MTQETNNSEHYVFTLTAFGTDTDQVATPLVLANSALANGKNVLLWLTMGSVRLVKKGVAESLKPVSFAPVTELLDAYIENGGRISVFPPCANTHGENDKCRQKLCVV